MTWFQPTWRCTSPIWSYPCLNFQSNFGAFCFDGFSPMKSHSEPIAAIGHPPAHEGDWNGGHQRPPQRQNEVRDQSQQNKHDPEDFSLHPGILKVNANDFEGAIDESLHSTHRLTY